MQTLKYYKITYIIETQNTVLTLISEIHCLLLYKIIDSTVRNI